MVVCANVNNYHDGKWKVPGKLGMNLSSAMILILRTRRQAVSYRFRSCNYNTLGKRQPKISRPRWICWICILNYCQKNQIFPHRTWPSTRFKLARENFPCFTPVSCLCNAFWYETNIKGWTDCLNQFGCVNNIIMLIQPPSFWMVVKKHGINLNSMTIAGFTLKTSVREWLGYVIWWA